MREEKRVFWPDRRKDKRGMTGISELYTGGERRYLLLLLSSETAPLCTRLLDNDVNVYPGF